MLNTKSLIFWNPKMHQTMAPSTAEAEYSSTSTTRFYTSEYCQLTMILVQCLVQLLLLTLPALTTSLVQLAMEPQSEWLQMQWVWKSEAFQVSHTLGWKVFELRMRFPRNWSLYLPPWHSMPRVRWLAMNRKTFGTAFSSMQAIGCTKVCSFMFWVMSRILQICISENAI